MIGSLKAVSMNPVRLCLVIIALFLGTVPAQAGRLTPAQIHLLASYVWSLSQSHQTAAR